MASNTKFYFSGYFVSYLVSLI